MLSGLYCTKLDDPIIGWGNKVSIETGGLNSPATSSSVNIANSSVSCRVSGLAGKRRGICWSESSSNVTVAGSKVEVGTGTGSFPATITGLSPVKTYYYRAYIILAEPNSALYGDLKSFTTPAGCPSFTVSGTATPTTASFVLNITSNGGATVTSCGVVYSSSVTNPIIGQANCFNAPLTSTPVIGNNNISVSGLTQATTYYVRAWAVNSAGTCYTAPAIPVVTTANLATLSTSPATLVTSTSATLGGSITSDGGTAITQRGVVYSSSVSNPTVLNNSPTTGAAGCISVLANPPTGTGSFSIPVTGLTSSVRYYVRAWAKNSASVVSYGAPQEFITPAQIVCPTINTSAATSVTSTSATLNGTISATGGTPIVEQGFVYSNSNSNPTVGGVGCTFVSHTPVGIAPYSRTITGLTASRTYYFKACARNSTTWCYGAVASFPTPGGGGSVSANSSTLVAVPDNSATGASSSINITIPSGRTITGISVTYNMTHTWVSDMVFNLRAPNGQILNLFNRHGNNGANFVNTTINSTSALGLSTALAPFTNNYAPTRAIGVGPTSGVSAATAYSNLYSAGTGMPQAWTLLMRDYAAGDTGILTSWSITITYN